VNSRLNPRNWRRKHILYGIGRGVARQTNTELGKVLIENLHIKLLHVSLPLRRSLRLDDFLQLARYPFAMLSIGYYITATCYHTIPYLEHEHAKWQDALLRRQASMSMRGWDGKFLGPRTTLRVSTLFGFYVVPVPRRALAVTMFRPRCTGALGSA
jgi:hypothetical protein